jgi:myo-inositol-1(or 4)-monophosphatase
MGTMWQKEMEIARKAASEAGKIIHKHFGQKNQVRKKGDIDLVTEADLQSEKTIIETITRAFPEDSILSEETGAHKHLPSRVWLIDPLDGTTNFAHAFPFFGVSIALEVRGRVVLGIVYNPCMNEWFEAVHAGGAFLNHQKITVSTAENLMDSLLATGFPYDVHENPDGVVARFKTMLTHSQGVRRPGSAALDLCYVACGRVDGYWEERLHPWDTAAGLVIVREAGGKVTDYTGSDYTPYSQTILASNGRIHQDMMRALQKA